MQNLRYDKIAEGVIGIRLSEGYTVIALRNWSKNKKCYVVSLYLKDDTVDNWDLMEKFEHLKVFVEKKDERIICSAITRAVTELYEVGELHYYIERYKYNMDCFNYGSENLGGD